MTSIAQAIPNDIVRSIFAPLSATLTTDEKQFPWFLGHICSRWRSIFLSMASEFWSRIKIGDWNRGSPPSELGCADRMSMIKFFLGRDPGAPFSFDFQSPSFFDRIPPYEETYLHFALDMLIDGSTRWKEACFTVDGLYLSSLSRVRGHLPQLQKLGLFHYTGIHRPDIPHWQDLFQSAPSLTHIELDDLSDWNFNWSNMKAVILKSGRGTSRLHPALPEMINLERLVVRGLRNHIHASVTLLPRLKSLETVPDLLPTLEAPALDHLRLFFTRRTQYLQFARPTDNQSPSIIISFLRRSLCRILRLGMSVCPSNTAIEIIRHTPEIVHLELDTMDDLGAVFKELTISSPLKDNNLPASHLRSLAIRSPRPDDMEPLLDLVLSRTSTPEDAAFNRLKSLVISAGHSAEVWLAMEHLRMLCKERGVQIIEGKW